MKRQLKTHWIFPTVTGWNKLLRYTLHSTCLLLELSPLESGNKDWRQRELWSSGVGGPFSNQGSSVEGESSMWYQQHVHRVTLFWWGKKEIHGNPAASININKSLFNNALLVSCHWTVRHKSLCTLLPVKHSKYFLSSLDFNWFIRMHKAGHKLSLGRRWLLKAHGNLTDWGSEKEANQSLESRERIWSHCSAFNLQFPLSEMSLRNQKTRAQVKIWETMKMTLKLLHAGARLCCTVMMHSHLQE